MQSFVSAVRLCTYGEQFGEFSADQNKVLINI